MLCYFHYHHFIANVCGKSHSNVVFRLKQNKTKQNKKQKKTLSLTVLTIKLLSRLFQNSPQFKTSILESTISSLY